MTNINYWEKTRDQKKILMSIGITLSFETLYEQAKGLIYPHKLLANLIDNNMELVKSGAEEILYNILSSK